MSKTPYTDRFAELAPGYDPRRIEAFMRLDTRPSTACRAGNSPMRPRSPRAASTRAGPSRRSATHDPSVCRTMGIGASWLFLPPDARACARGRRRGPPAATPRHRAGHTRKPAQTGGSATQRCRWINFEHGRRSPGWTVARPATVGAPNAILMPLNQALAPRPDLSAGHGIVTGGARVQLDHRFELDLKSRKALGNRAP